MPELPQSPGADVASRQVQAEVVLMRDRNGFPVDRFAQMRHTARGQLESARVPVSREEARRMLLVVLASKGCPNGDAVCNRVRREPGRFLESGICMDCALDLEAEA